ncbi:hypothetical protein B005_5141 [Nocardiopsis alba ATCC BAA-2165]|uniref:Uncharacterized protein n=1 Tax=Nocardiopsis alba (strain ATCC BAA-2165 / BE74) TaxID=1205910 RepID=J7KXP1_NOCAA|nr:hypothetical protein B005_5141 [Nocardiopsis alba ATCC BAA-2165]
MDHVRFASPFATSACGTPCAHSFEGDRTGGGVSMVEGRGRLSSVPFG